MKITSTQLRLLIVKLEEHLKILEKYLHSKYLERDWHGVSDAANDVREVEAKLAMLKLL